MGTTEIETRTIDGDVYKLLKIDDKFTVFRSMKYMKIAEELLESDKDGFAAITSFDSLSGAKEFLDSLAKAK